MKKVLAIVLGSMLLAAAVEDPAHADNRDLAVEYPAIILVAKDHCAVSDKFDRTFRYALAMLIRRGLTTEEAVAIVANRATHIEYLIMKSDKMTQFCVNVWEGKW